MRVVVTGGAGFIGSNLVRWLLRERPDWQVRNLDALTYAGNLENLKGVDADPRYAFLHGDVADPDAVEAALADVDAVLHLAAESHVDRSIASATDFVRTNVVGTETLLAAARRRPGLTVVVVSTDEVYGELPWQDPEAEGPRERFTAGTPVAPRSPYAASKAAGDLLALAYHRTHGVDVRVTRASNNYGPYQFPEKLIPLMITNGIEGRDLPVYGDGLHIRDWIHVDDHCRGIVATLERGRAGEVYLFGGDAERTNRAVVEGLAGHLDVGPERIRSVPDRPGHDRRYAIDWSGSERALGWRPLRRFDEGLAETVDWYRGNVEWWTRVRDGRYQRYYEALYGPGGRSTLGA
ncbi:MAG: dTDP-glucose 4,6-dehydratase [Gemmatimonadota bacterium]|nr:dTDP-glucose 4,6-dehydratase [Gemmatimonadota bacterium]